MIEKRSRLFVCIVHRPKERNGIGLFIVHLRCGIVRQLFVDMRPNSFRKIAFSALGTL